MLDAFFIFIVIYLLTGITVARLVDSAQMKQPVPFGEFPSMFRLEQIRTTVFFFMVLARPFYAAKQALRHILRGRIKA